MKKFKIGDLVKDISGLTGPDYGIIIAPDISDGNVVWVFSLIKHKKFPFELNEIRIVD